MICKSLHSFFNLHFTQSPNFFENEVAYTFVYLYVFCTEVF